MDQRKQSLLEALKVGGAEGSEMRLYRRGKLPGLFAQRTRLNAEVANQAVQDGLLEVTRVEAVGKTTVEWVRVTPKGLDLLLQSESPTGALEELRDVLAINQEGMPRWVAEMNARISEHARRYADEVAQMKQRLDQLSQRVIDAIERMEAAQRPAAPPPTPWAHELLDYLDRRKQVGLGGRCPLADLFALLKENHADMTVKEFHAGLKRMQESDTISLLPSTGVGDNPGPEYALLDGAVVYYYVARS